MILRLRLPGCDEVQAAGASQPIAVAWLLALLALSTTAAASEAGRSTGPSEAATSTCDKPEKELLPLERVAPRFPMDGPRKGYIRDGDLVVFELGVDSSGKPVRIDLVCTTASPVVVRVARTAIERSRFAPADAAYSGRISVSFHLSTAPMAPAPGSDD